MESGKEIQAIKHDIKTASSKKVLPK